MIKILYFVVIEILLMPSINDNGLYVKLAFITFINIPIIGEGVRG